MLVNYVTRFTAATIAEIAYGHTVNSLDDSIVKVAEKATSATVSLGRWVDQWPLFTS